MPRRCRWDDSQRQWPFSPRSQFRCHSTAKNIIEMNAVADPNTTCRGEHSLTAHVPSPIAGMRFPSLKFICGTFVLPLAILSSTVFVRKIRIANAENVESITNSMREFAVRWFAFDCLNSTRSRHSWMLLCVHPSRCDRKQQRKTILSSLLLWQNQWVIANEPKVIMRTSVRLGMTVWVALLTSWQHFPPHLPLSSAIHAHTGTSVTS